MIVEKYDANPAANTFEHVTVVLDKKHVCRFVSVAGDYPTELSRCFLAIYRGSVTSWNLTNNQYAIYTLGWINQGWGATYALLHRNTPGESMYVELPPGTYTFAVNLVTDVANFRMAWHLQEV